MENIRDLFDYHDGELFWKKNGKRAGCLHKHDKYWKIGLHAKRYQRSRLIWLWHYGKLPVEDIDHINGNKSDDRIENLREANCAQNGYNCAVRRTNRAGFKGVTYRKEYRSKPFRARITINGKNKELGYFKTPTEAAAAYQKAADFYQGEFAYHNSRD